MRALRHITAACLAILFASPLCCCATHAAPTEEAPVHSCCSRGVERDPAPAHAPECACQAKSPRIADGGKAIILSVNLPEIAPLSLFSAKPLVQESTLVPANAPVSPYPRPPRLLLVLRQSFLI